jgi:Asp-tRNA(Asn)/Glu-tRNA(Gln) amidotransferase A subunit family amidase
LLRGQTAEAVALMDPGLVALCRRGAAVTQEEYVAAVTRRAALGQAVRLFFDRFDLLLSPTMPIPGAYADSRDDGATNPANFSELDALHLAIQPDQEPVLLDPLRFRRRAANRTTG